MPSLILAATLAAISAGDPAATLPDPNPDSGGAVSALSLDEQEKLRCAATFALVAGLQQRQQETPFPVLGTRGQEYFLQATAEVMDSAGLNRKDLTERLQALAATLAEPGRLEAAMPSCLASLDSSGL